MKQFRLNSIALAMISALALAACSSNSSSVTGGSTSSTDTSSSSSSSSSGSSSSGSSSSGSSSSGSSSSGSSSSGSSSSGSSSSGSSSSGSSSSDSSNSGSSSSDSSNSGSTSSDNTNSSSTDNTSSNSNTDSTKLKDTIAQGFSGVAPESFMDANYDMVTRFVADVVSINADGTVQHQRIEDDKRGVSSKSFTLNNTRINLLNDSQENQEASNSGGLALRQMQKGDFGTVSASGSVSDATNPLHATNPSWVGSISENSISNWGDEMNNLGSYRNLRYGVYNDADGNSHLFVFGLPASVSKSSGTLIYTGSAIVGKDGKYDGLSNAFSGSVDFGSKAVTLKIKRDAGDLNFGGTLNGNVFEGTQNNVYTKGGLYGTSINSTVRNSNIGGMFTVIDGDEKGVNGVYGGAQAQ